MNYLYEFPYTDHFTANSSVIAAVYYNKNEQLLAILFKRGDVTVYSGVDSEEFSRLHSALSVGVYYNQRIKGQYGSQSWGDRVKFYKLAEKKTLDQHPEFNTVEEKSGDVNVTINIYVNGNPEDVAKAVERLAPSFRAMKR
ncbi:hypothetical protein SEA_GENIE2_247 [Streptomyces phage Genie2]|uniref:KTSC domain-containing protein n=1 Tax=Streptomyces phage Genie2 TaxID=2502445 RepID=A0A411C4V5_9CAUD|nr:hypothetical protein SEA_GENIE2_247 [Streptomyces phage Genie2]WNM73794.1 hypothetical protein SEA_SOLLERTIA_248 [Streptomyces phage Sollertia]